MATLKFKDKITDDITDALDIIRNVGKSIQAGHAEKAAVMSSLSQLYSKIESAKYYIDRG